MLAPNIIIITVNIFEERLPSHDAYRGWPHTALQISRSGVHCLQQHESPHSQRERKKGGALFIRWWCERAHVMVQIHVSRTVIWFLCRCRINSKVLFHLQSSRKGGCARAQNEKWPACHFMQVFLPDFRLHRKRNVRRKKAAAAFLFLYARRNLHSRQLANFSVRQSY